MNTDKIIDDAREKIAEILEQPCDVCELEDNCDCKIRGIICPYQEKKAYQILALSGTTDIECPEYHGTGLDVEPSDCAMCNGTGVIKHKWKVSVTLENGELPRLRTIPMNAKETKEIKITIPEWWDDVSLVSYLGRIHQQDMLNAKYRQVVE